jgi:hypothetical protein
LRAIFLAADAGQLKSVLSLIWPICPEEMTEDKLFHKKGEVI